MRTLFYAVQTEQLIFAQASNENHSCMRVSTCIYICPPRGRVGTRGHIYMPSACKELRASCWIPLSVLSAHFNHIQQQPLVQTGSIAKREYRVDCTSTWPNPRRLICPNPLASYELHTLPQGMDAFSVFHTDLTKCSGYTINVRPRKTVFGS